ncbi:MAG: nucleotide sugar dehydrogenase [Pelagibacteraceae bacterium]|jgi:UDPglucose 6-dehydrogenase|nr:nucleotide sugar dehydrogenase [Pelagibacteraceae bacterium]
MKITKICCIGAGYVGGPTMAVIAAKCPEIKVTVVDKSEEKIRMWNSKNLNEIPVFEPGLKEILSEVRNKNLFFSSDIESSVDESEMIFIAVNTPTKTSGKGKGMAADLSNVISTAREIAKFSKSDKIIVEKSTLPVRTAEKIKEILSLTNKRVKFEILSNPEFLAEGTAIKDLFKSDRVLIGGDDTKSGRNAVKCLTEIYEKWIPQSKILKTSVWSSELSKLAANAMLAQRISSINSLSALCEKTGANIKEISKAIGMDKRIGSEFLNASVGFGGSCFQKDILNLVYLSRHYGLNDVADFWHQVVKINDYQKNRFAENIKQFLNNDIKNKKISILGWAFKKNTNDSRESASIEVTSILLQNGAYVDIFDPMVSSDKITSDLTNLWSKLNISKTLRDQMFSKITIRDNHIDAIENSSLTAILTEWDEFKSYEWESITKKMISPSIVYDGRAFMSDLNTKINYYSIGVI